MRAVPKVSIIVPSYNKTQYLHECLRSIQAQTFEDWECIVVSDGSPRTPEVHLAVSAINDHRIRVIEHSTNRGLAAARNTGMKEARAEWGLFIDEDDLLVEDCLSELINVAHTNDPDIVCCEGIVFYENGRSAYRKISVPTKDDVLHSTPLLGTGFLLRKEVWRRLGGWDESPVLKLGREDHEWWIRAIYSDCSIAVVRKPLYLIRQFPPSHGFRISLNQSAMRYERKIRSYIMSKHAVLYRGKSRAKRIMKSKGLWYEGVWYFENGSKMKGSALIVGSLFYEPTLKGLLSLAGLWKRCLCKNIVALAGR